MNSKLSGLKAWSRRYLSMWTLISLVVVGFVLFYGDHTIFTSVSDNRTADSLRTVLQAKVDSTEYYRELNRRLRTDHSLMEQVVREQYRMKRAHEDVYLMTDEE